MTFAQSGDLVTNVAGGGSHSLQVQEAKAEPSGPANGTQPVRPETNQGHRPLAPLADLLSTVEGQATALVSLRIRLVCLMPSGFCLERISLLPD